MLKSKEHTWGISTKPHKGPCWRGREADGSLMALHKSGVLSVKVADACVLVRQDASGKEVDMKETGYERGYEKCEVHDT